MQESTSGTRSRRNGDLATRGGIAVVLAVVANAGVLLAVNAGGIAPDFRALTFPPVAFLSALGAAGATVTYALLGRFGEDRDRLFVRVATAVLLVSFVPDLALLSADPEATVPGVVVLMLMHVVVAVVAVGSLLWGR